MLRDNNGTKDVVINWIILLFVLCPLFTVGIALPFLFAVSFIVRMITNV